MFLDVKIESPQKHAITATLREIADKLDGGVFAENNQTAIDGYDVKFEFVFLETDRTKVDEMRDSLFGNDEGS